MRNTNQRVSAVKQQIAKLNQEKRNQQGRIITISSLAASLLLIIGLSFIMPGLMGNLSSDLYINSGLTASVFDADKELGYLIIALLAFALGVSVTILSYRIHLRNQVKKEELNIQEQEKENGRAD